MRCKICNKNECSQNNNVCQFCSTTGMEYRQSDQDSIKEHGRCCACYEEWGDNWGDKI